MDIENTNLISGDIKSISLPNSLETSDVPGAVGILQSALRRIDNQGNLISLPVFSPKGRAEWHEPGTYTWTVPKNVYVVAIALSGTGGAGRTNNGSGGGSGGISYDPYVSVEPGDIVDLNIGPISYFRSGEDETYFKVGEYALNAGRGQDGVNSTYTTVRAGEGTYMNGNVNSARHGAPSVEVTLPEIGNIRSGRGGSGGAQRNPPGESGSIIIVWGDLVKPTVGEAT